VLRVSDSELDKGIGKAVRYATFEAFSSLS
jgi:hypothetical protein